MFETRTHKVEDRIVSIHQPHVRPIGQGKGTPIRQSLAPRSTCQWWTAIRLWTPSHGMLLTNQRAWWEYVENFRKRFGHYPEKVLVDKIYATRDNRNWLKQMDIKILAKPLGRPSAKAVANHVSPGGTKSD